MCRPNQFDVGIGEILLKWLKRIVLGLVAISALVVVSGIGYEQWSRWSAAREYPPPGELIDVDGRNIHLNCTGSGSPTVILEHGASNYGSVSWVLVQPEIAKANRVCSYDRDGVNWSDQRVEPRSAIQITDELHSVLNAASESPPYVMVGHSFGGELIRFYTYRYPQEVSGLVFVDSSHPDQNQRYADLFEYEAEDYTWQDTIYDRMTAATGVMRIFDTVVYGVIPEEAKIAHEYTPQSMPSLFREQLAVPQIRAEIRESGSFGDLPLIVLTGGEGIYGPTPEEAEEMDEADVVELVKDGQLWLDMQGEIAMLSTISDHRVVEHSGNRIPFEAPEEVIRAVHDVIAMTRTVE